MGSEGLRGPAAARGPGQGDPRALRRDCQHRWAEDCGGTGGQRGQQDLGMRDEGLGKDSWGKHMGRGAGPEERAPKFRYGRDTCIEKGKRPWVSCRHAGVGAGPNRGLLSPLPVLHILHLPFLLQLHFQLPSLFFSSSNLLWGPWARMCTQPSQSTDQRLG